MVVDTKEFRKEMIEHEIPSVLELSKISGVDRNTIMGILNHGKKPSVKTMEKFIKVFGWSGARAGEIFFAEKLT